MTNIKDFLDNNKIIIPKIQRDYAHGRNRKEENAIINKLLDDLINVLSGEKEEIVLNYIYGVPKENDKGKYIVLIDGQQRITTLYLLRLFISANIDDEDNSFYGHLSYETRDTSKEFCEFLNEFKNLDALKSGGESISKRLYDKMNFFVRWRNDPTVKSMLNVLDKINEKSTVHKENFNIWKENLKNIKFSFISLEGFKREEELYSTMNGRGKQLTPFEQLKPELINQVDDKDKEEFAGEINDGWLPFFWNYAIEKNSGNISEAQNKHDGYMYNCFSFIVAMLYVQRHKQTKKNDLPSIIAMLGEITEDYEFLRFAMTDGLEYVNEFSFGDKIKTAKKENISNEFIVTDEEIKTDILFCCCENDKDFTKLSKFFLWAYLKFIYNEKHSSLNNHLLVEYFILARDLYADSWDSNTPTALGKSPNDMEFFQAVYRFNKILNDEEEKSNPQYKVFNSKDQYFYDILNNPLTRGRSTNISIILECSTEEKETFRDNLNYLYNNSGEKSFKSLCSMGYPYFINGKDDNRIYVPCGEKMLKSLFSLSSWADTRYDNRNLSIEFLEKLCSTQLKDDEGNSFGFSDWQYYIIKYNDWFGEKKNPYCAFITNNNGPDFSMTGIYGERASSGQTVSPFLYAAYCKKHGETTVKECTQYSEKHSFNIIDNGSNVRVLFDEKDYSWNKENDFVEFLYEILPDIN